MDNGTRKTETTAQSEWRRRLQAGERIYLYRQPVYFVLAALLIAGSIAFCVWFIFPLLTGGPSRIAPGKTLASILFPIVFTAIWLLITAFMVGTVRFASVRFEPGGLKLWNWRKRQQQVDFADVVAMSSHYKYSQKGGGHWVVAILHLTPGMRGGSSWSILYVASRKEIAEVFADEIADRCQLTESRPKSDGDEDDVIRQRPGTEYDFKPMPWWMS
ncbi:MAG: hypothetical protein GTO55_07010 [Armatimonadetes bacterium]|nr:hypothetical protein [Armatimonadota bacterium]NIM24023.1 hypothetical protein [Armatimonadota bacterium]NIM67873.1 hypothetical protein [Armatimonadota bacterium]NIM76401.1 hypothetical protein [Armatimonadota bacterium]NIN06103.1 hypothetical protein [Armatimonadota bacterium]